MPNGRRKETESYGIVGLGRFGTALAEELAASGAELLVVDREEEKVSRMRELTENAYVVKTLDRKSLEETGIQNCDVAVVCIGEHMDTSILTTLHLVGMGIPRVIAKAATPEHGEILTKLGAEVVFPEHDMAVRLAHRLEASRMLDFVQLSEKLTIYKLLIPERMIGKTVQDVKLRRTFGVNIVAIENGGALNESVAPEYVFRKGDVIFVAGGKDNLERLMGWAAR